MRVAGNIRLDDIDEGSRGVRCGRRFVGAVRFGSFGCRSFRNVVCKCGRSGIAVGNASISRFRRSIRGGGKGAGFVTGLLSAGNAGIRT